MRRAWAEREKEQTMGYWQSIGRWRRGISLALVVDFVLAGGWIGHAARPAEAVGAGKNNRIVH